MICKQCGTQSVQPYCPYCGAPLSADNLAPQQYIQQIPYAPQQYAQQATYASQPYTQQSPYVPQVPYMPQQTYVPQNDYAVQGQSAPQATYATPREPQYVPQPAAVTDPQSKAEKEGQSKAKPARTKKKHAHVSFGRAFFPILMLLWPSFYLLSNIFVCIAPQVGSASFSVFAQLMSADGAQSAVSQIMAEDFLTGNSPFLYVSLLSFDAAPIAFWCTAALCVLCVVMACATLFSGGKLLRFALFRDALAFAGVAGATAPLCGLLAQRGYLALTQGAAVTDLLMQQISLTAQTVLGMAVMLVLMLPSVAYLCRAGARAAGKREHVLCLHSVLTHGSFGVNRVIAICAMLGAIVTGVFGMDALFSGMGSSFFDVAKNIPTVFSEGYSQYLAVQQTMFYPDPIIFLEALPTIMATVTVLVFLWGCVRILYPFLRVCFARKKKLAGKSAACMTLRDVQIRVRTVALAPMLALIGVQLGACAFCLLRIFSVMDLNNVTGTHAVLYTVSFGVRALLPVFGKTVLWGLCAAFLWHLAGNATRRMIDSSYQATANDNKKESA